MRIAPIMAVIDFVPLDPHRRFRWHYVLVAGVKLATGGRRQYPYDFINLDALSCEVRH